MSEFTDMIEKPATTPGKLLIVSDFNVHWGKSSPETKRFVNILEAGNLRQNVEGETHRSCHTVD